MFILIVEDEQPVAEVLRRALERFGNSCVVAGSAADATRLLRARDVDAVTLDLGLPDDAGLNWLETLAHARPELARRTLVITGGALETESVARVARCGAGVLAKPFTLDDLGDAVRSQLEHPSFPRSLAH